MSNSYDNSQSSKALLSTRNLILASLAWAVLALLYYLLFSAKTPDSGGNLARATWYILGTNIFEAVAYLSAGALCLRNWLSTQIVSGRNVWLLIGLGMVAYAIGGIIFGYTEMVLKQNPDVSLSDVFFVMTYLFLAAGMVLAVVSRRINLERQQWLVVFAIGVCGSFLAWWISGQKPTETGNLMADVLNWFYVVSDVFLLIIATTLLLAFWGGLASLSWQMIASATFSLYIADMWFKYAQQSPDYQSGELLEVFWVFSGVLFGVGAILEYDASLNRKRRASGRKRT